MATTSSNTSSNTADDGMNPVPGVPFREAHPLTKRQAEAARVRARYPDRIPCIAEKHEKSKLQSIDKVKFLVPDHLTVGQFVFVLRQKIELDPAQALFLFINNKLPASSALMSTVYRENKDEDGFLYVVYSNEDTYGATRSSSSSSSCTSTSTEE